MALTVESGITEMITLQEYMEYIEQSVDLDDFESVAASAPMLKALANDRTLLVRHFNELLQKGNYEELPLYTPQSFRLGSGRGFYVRGNIWKPLTTQERIRRLEERLFSYNTAHDHNFMFVTVGYHGPGYETVIYEYDRSKVIGYPGEPVELQFLERTTLPAGKLMVFRESVDVHTQLPPPAMSISLNLMISPDSITIKDQYFFDLEKRSIIGIPAEAHFAKRATILEMAGCVGDDETIQLLDEIAHRHPCKHARLSAVNGLRARLAPDDLAARIEDLSMDQEPFVRQRVSELL